MEDGNWMLQTSGGVEMNLNPCFTSILVLQSYSQICILPKKKSHIICVETNTMVHSLIIHCLILPFLHHSFVPHISTNPAKAPTAHIVLPPLKLLAPSVSVAVSIAIVDVLVIKDTVLLPGPLNTPDGILPIPVTSGRTPYPPPPK